MERLLLRQSLPEIQKTVGVLIFLTVAPHNYTYTVELRDILLALVLDMFAIHRGEIPYPVLFPFISSMFT